MTMTSTQRLTRQDQIGKLITQVIELGQTTRDLQRSAEKAGHAAEEPLKLAANALLCAYQDLAEALQQIQLPSGSEQQIQIPTQTNGSDS